MENESQHSGPDFIGIGVQRAGTSWLYECLKEHKEVYLPGKELNFFNQKFDKGLDWYFSLFSKKSAGHLISGEFTPDYMFSNASMIKIAEHCPQAKLIIILRDPFERAFSAYNLMFAHGRYDESESFQEAVKKDPWIIEQSLYASQLEHVYSLFPKQQIKVYLFEDIANRPMWLLQDVYQFLGVNPNFKPSRFDEKYNVSGMSGMQNKLKLPQIQKKLLHNSYGRKLLLLKRFKFVRKFKSWLLDKDDNANNKLKHCNPELRSLLKEDLRKASQIVDKNFENWY